MQFSELTINSRALLKMTTFTGPNGLDSLSDICDEDWQDSRHEAKSRYPGEDSTGDPAQTRQAPVSVEVAQITVSFGWVCARFTHIVALCIGTGVGPPTGD